ncbi:UV DNA damage repair endonuclease UvsE [Anaerosacchariphilus polymeriproducens]|uniref:UV DNA damage repair endonuclease UvsE n=1 Tax=Anaerosacchariphilus polymeriproducens TaxID=1812858 RepID=A0A371AR16_9FIRM|nr:UV DNA damage repair endonuclease UvsE [Anaerosacchariphilus polymeriproducens]RDU21984.1 UV DNA damage repair endonuclease UvsE [Anaerosacchariphilus polymeriproducens]
MSIGYACLTMGVSNTQLRSCIKKNAQESNLLEIIEHNLGVLDNILEYNQKNHIKLFRISSDLIPFGSAPINNIPWWEIFSDRFEQLGSKIRSYHMRVSMHPGQYTVLNSPKEEVVLRAIDDLTYHTKVLDCLGMGKEHKIVLHIGGVYHDKEESIHRFIRNYLTLKQHIKNRLVIENDDKSYNISEVLRIGKILNIPVIFDNLHNKINSGLENINEFEWIEECKKLWKKEDGKQKIHYSQQNVFKSKGSHSDTIEIREFMDFYKRLNRNDIDIMLEVKDKNLSAVKCINCTSKRKEKFALIQEWNKYKYTILEKSPIQFEQIIHILEESKECLPVSFYCLIQEGMNMEPKKENMVNAAQDIWYCYFREIVTDKEQKNFFENINKLQNGEIKIARVKKDLMKLAEKYQSSLLLNSYYFYL